MQKEHVMYGLTALSVDCEMRGMPNLASVLVELASQPDLTIALAEYLTESDEDELVQFLIEKRIRNEYN